MADTHSELHRTLHLVADAAIAAGDALQVADPDALRRAVDALVQNTERARTLAACVAARWPA